MLIGDFGGLHGPNNMRISHNRQAENSQIAKNAYPVAQDGGRGCKMPAGYDFERCFIRVAVRLAEGQGKSKTDLAKAIFGEGKKDAYRTLQAMLVPPKPAQVSGPRKMLLREAFSASKALGMRLSDLILLTESETQRSQDDESLDHNGLASA